MKDFVNFEEIESIDKKNFIKPIEKITQEVGDTLNKLELVETLEETETCYMERDNSGCYGDREEEGSFKIRNLFSELTNEYERANARQNLGIGDSETLTWGSIKGNIKNQRDLEDYIFNSPAFRGMPTTPTPFQNDFSKTIPNTLWVLDFVSNFDFDNNPKNLTSFVVNPGFGYKGDVPTQVLVKWEYEQGVTEQKLNGEEIHNLTREKTINVSDDCIIQLEYTFRGVQYIKYKVFKFVYPIYYGKSNLIEELNKIASKEFVINLNIDEYAYICYPSNKLRIDVNGLIGGFIIVNEFTLHGTQYYLYKSVNHSLGELNITLL